MTRLLELQADNASDLQLLQQFLNTAGSSLETFRYYNKRPLSVTANHFCTLLLLSDDRPVAYGHLDPEKEKVWLGIAVVDAFKGRGLGKKIMDLLIAKAREKKCPGIFLSVDKQNTQAIRLYQHYGFTIVQDLDADIYLMNLTLDHE
jgi:GNAT superfamily N-acetyltransferase